MDRLTDWLVTGERPLPFFVSSFAAPAGGGGKDEDEDDDPDEDDDEDEDDDPDAEKSDEELRAELKKTRLALGKANGQSAKRRQALRAKEQELEEARKVKPKAKAKDDDEDAPDVDAIRDEARRDGEKSGTLRAKRAEAKSELIAAGIPREKAVRAVGMLNLDELDLDDDGLDGIDEAIEKLRADVPELFAGRRKRREGVGGDREGGEDKASRRGAEKLSVDERQARAALGIR